VRSHGLVVKRLFAGGGGAKSRLWIQIHAGHSGNTGSAAARAGGVRPRLRFGGGVHAGRFADLTEAAREMVRIAEVVEPRPETRSAYEKDTRATERRIRR